MFLIRGIVFSHEAVRDWETKLAPVLAKNLRRRRHGKVGRSWYVDETYIKVHGAVALSLPSHRPLGRAGRRDVQRASRHGPVVTRSGFHPGDHFRRTQRTPSTGVTTDGARQLPPGSIRIDPGDSCRAIATASISITDWSRIIAASKAAMVRCAGSNVHDRPATSVVPTTSYATFSVPAPKPIRKSPPTAASSTSSAAPQRS